MSIRIRHRFIICFLIASSFVLQQVNAAAHTTHAVHHNAVHPTQHVATKSHSSVAHRGKQFLKMIVGIVVGCIVGSLLLCVCCCFLLRRRKNRSSREITQLEATSAMPTISAPLSAQPQVTAPPPPHTGGGEAASYYNPEGDVPKYGYTGGEYNQGYGYQGGYEGAPVRMLTLCTVRADWFLSPKPPPGPPPQAHMGGFRQ